MTDIESPEAFVGRVYRDATDSEFKLDEDAVVEMVAARDEVIRADERAKVEAERARPMPIEPPEAFVEGLEDTETVRAVTSATAPRAVPDSLDDLERAMEELIERLPQGCKPASACAFCGHTYSRIAQARELVRRLRAGIVECEYEQKLLADHGHLMQPEELSARRAVNKSMRRALTGATGEERE